MKMFSKIFWEEFQSQGLHLPELLISPSTKNLGDKKKGPDTMASSRGSAFREHF